jgi:hypothetical protein
MPPSPEPTPLRGSLQYPASDVAVEGILTDLPGKLSTVLEYDRVGLEGLTTPKRITLWFRRGARRIFEVRMVRRGGRWLVGIGGLDPARVYRGILICRDHFDCWFGVSPQEVQAFERERQRPAGKVPSEDSRRGG